MNSVSLEIEMKRNQKLKIEDIETLREWCKEQQHLPEIKDNDLALFLHSNYYNIEATKKNIENYFTMRTRFTEFFSWRDPAYSFWLRDTFDIVSVISLKERTREGYNVILIRLIDTDPKFHIYDDVIKYLHMVIDLCVYEEGTAMKGYVIVFDINRSTNKLATSISHSSMKKLFDYIKNGSPIQWISLHYLNISSDNVHEFVKTKIFTNEFTDSLISHSSIESLNEFVPLEILPNEMGGRAGLLMDLHKEQIEKLNKHRDWFLLRDFRSKVDESLRPKKDENKTETTATDNNCKNSGTGSVKSSTKIISS